MSEKEYKVVTAHIFQPHNSLFKEAKNTKSECQAIRCCNSENCGLYSRGRCSWMTPIGYHKCPYGKYNKEIGPTKRAKTYLKWIKERQTRYEGLLDKLKMHLNVLAKVGDYIFLPYSYMTDNESIPFLAHGGFFRTGNGFLLKENFTIDNIILICNFIPLAMTGGAIPSYQKEEVPKFIQHLSENMPDVYSELCLKYDRAIKIVNENSYVGREALLSTLVPNIGEFIDIHKGSWIWDGKYLTSHNSKASFMLSNKFFEIRILPDEKCKVKITDNNQVNKDTVLID